MSDKLQEIYDTIPWYRKLWFNIKFKFELLAYKIVGEWLEGYVSLFWLHYYGNYPIAIVKNYNGETTFLFENYDQEQRAFNEVEKDNQRAIGWYYAIEDFQWEIEEDDHYNWNDLEIWWIYGKG